MSHISGNVQFGDVIQEVTYHCIWTIISVGVILRDKRILLGNVLPYTLKSPNKQLMETFIYFVVSLQSRFYTFVLFFVCNVYIYSSSLRLFMIDPVVSLQPATHRQYLIVSVVFAVTLALRYCCFKYHDCVN